MAGCQLSVLHCGLVFRLDLHLPLLQLVRRILLVLHESGHTRLLPSLSPLRPLSRLSRPPTYSFRLTSCVLRLTSSVSPVPSAPSIPGSPPPPRRRGAPTWRRAARPSAARRPGP